MTFLALDVGNTRLKWARYEAACPGAKLLEQGAVFLENIDKLADDEWRDMPAPSAILGCIVAADAVKGRVAEQMEHWDVVPRWVVSSAHEAGVINGYDHPARLGADRWVAMIGAWHRLLARGSSKPCVVVMVGTAVTVEAIDSSGRFLGGIILPGHGIMLRTLEQSMFWVPQSGDVGLGVSILSYGGGVQFGVITDSLLCPEPQQIIDEFMPEFARLSIVTLMLPWGDD